MPSPGDFPQASQILIQPFTTDDGGLTYTAPTSGGRSYQTDTSFEPYRRQSTRHTTIQSQRESINLEGKTGEGTVNTEGLWRVQVPDWSYGAGQLYADRQGSVANRFLASTGVDVFSLQYQATMLNPTIQVSQQQNNAAPLVVSLGPYVIWAYTTEVKWVKDTWSNAPTNLAFDGSDFAGDEFITGIMVDQHALYVSTNKNLYQSNILDGASPSTAVIIVKEGCITVGAAGGRLFVAGWGAQNILFDVTNASSSSPDVLPTGSGAFANGQLAVHANPKWLWHTVALVDGGFYFSGQPLDNDSSLVPNSSGEVWYTAYPQATQTGAANSPLPAPQICLSLPPGEVVASMFQYANFCILGTTQGVRVCRTVSANDPEGNTGNLISGPILPNLTQPISGAPVNAFTANGRFVWFTWPGYNDEFVGGTTTPANSVVLGKLDMETMVDDLTPAYASDLVFPTPNGYMISMAWDPISNGPVLGIELAASGNGLWIRNAAELRPTGFIDSGLITNNIPDDKIAAMVSARYTSAGSISFQVNADGQGYEPATPVSPNTISSNPVLLTTLRRYEEMNVQVTLNAYNETLAPILKRWTLKSLPAVVSGTDLSFVVMLYSQVGSHAIKRTVDPYAELAWLEQLRLSQTPVLISEGNPNQTLYTATAVVDSLDWLPEHERDQAPYFGWDGVCVVYLKTLVG